MSLTTTPEPADATAVNVPAPRADENLPARADRKKKGMSTGAHAALWIVIGFLFALVAISAWPLAQLLMNGGNGDITGGGGYGY